MELAYWLQYADYFQWPFVTIFDSLEDLAQKLNTLDLREISRKMKQHNKIREADLLNNWCRITKKLSDEQNIPTSYKKALQSFDINVN